MSADETVPKAGPAKESLASAFPTLRLREKLSYAMGDVGSNVVYSPATTFVLFYLTNIVGIRAAIAGTVLLLGQLLNGVTDLVVGVLIDKTKSRWGKTRPWILFSAIPLGIVFILLFSVPAGLNDTGKVVWTFVMYALLMAVFYTASNVAYSALLSVITPNPKTRVTLTTFRFFAALLTTLVVSSITLPVIASLGNGQTAWTTLMSIYGIIAALTLIIVFLGTKERLAPTRAPEGGVAQPLGAQLKDLFRNKYFLLAAALFTSFYLMNGFGQSSGVYYATNILGDASLFSILSIVGTVPLLVGIGFMPALMGRYGKRHMFLIGLAFMFVGSLLPIFAPTNLPVVIAGLLIRSVGTVPLTAGLFAIVADVVDYGEWKNGLRTDGLIFAAVVFGQKLGGGLGSAAVGWILGSAGYDPTVQAQSRAASRAILASYFYIPLALVIVTTVIVWFFRVEQYRPQIEEYLHGHVETAGSDPTPAAADSKPAVSTPET